MYVPTFQGRQLGSNVVLTYLNASLVRELVWRVSEHCSHNGHETIFLDIRNRGDDTRMRNRSGKPRIACCPSAALEEKIFLAALKGDYDPKEKMSQN